MKIGILGGSFDPIHNGHMQLAQVALKECNLDEVWLMPSGHSPHKDESGMTLAPQRFAMCQLATENEKAIIVSDFEIRKNETSYTYRTMEQLSVEYPEDTFYFIMGADSLDYFDHWKHPEIICKHATLLVVNRDNYSIEYLSQKCNAIQMLFPAQIRILNAKKVSVSSSEIRAQIKANKQPEGICEKVYG